MASGGKGRDPRTKLEQQLARLKGDLERKEAAIAKARDEHAQLEAERERVAAELKRLGSRELKVTDHAALRYLERVKGTLDREALDAEIVTDELQGLVDRLGGSGRIPLPGSGFTVVLKDYAIITVTTKDGQDG